MKPPPFDYRRAESVDHALELLASEGEDAHVLAGGQSLIPMLNLRLVRPSALIDINGAGLDGIEATEGHLRIGATVRHRWLEQDPRVAEEAPLLAFAAALVGHPAIRTLGTLGGSLAHADPAAELPAAVLALDAEIEARSVRGLRTIPAREFFVGPFSTALAHDEMVIAVRVPRSPLSGSAYEELSLRAGDFAIAGVAASLTLYDDHVDSARIAVFGVAGTPLRAVEAEALLSSAPVDKLPVEDAVATVFGDATPRSDMHGSSSYRLALVRTLTRRAIGSALLRARARVRS